MADNDIITLTPSNYTASNGPHQNAGHLLNRADNFVARKIFKIAIFLVAFLSFYWWVDSQNWYRFQIFLFFLTVVTVIALLLAPKLNMAIFGFGAFFGRNKDQNFLAAGSDEVLAWVTKGIPGILFGIMLFMAAFIVYPWSLNFFAYWLLLGVVLICFTMMYIYAWGGSWIPHITFIGCLLVGAYILIGSATGNVVLGNIPTLDHISVPGLSSNTTPAPQAPAAPQYASPFYPELGELQPIILAPGQTSEEISAYDGMPVCWTTVPGLIRESKNDKGEWHNGVESKAFAYRFTNPKTSKESLTVRPWRKSGSSCS